MTKKEYNFLFRKFVAQHNKHYHVDEFHVRFQNFKDNLELVSAHNKQGKSFKLAVNQFADMSKEDFRAKYLGFKFVDQAHLRAQNTAPVSNNFSLPASVDWNAKGAVTPVKNQGQCGSCWAFSTTGSVEGAVFISKGKLTSVSEQQLVDCSTAEGNQGCNGGLMDYGFAYIIKNKGIGSEASYPYHATDGTCKKVPSVSTISAFTDVQTGSETALMTAIVQQPISVAVEADQDSFQLYTGGVMSKACGTQLDHGVLAVGYGTLAGADYYQVKNSWGADWGMKGYILLARGSFNGNNGQCGIQMDPSYPTA